MSAPNDKHRATVPQIIREVCSACNGTGSVLRKTHYRDDAEEFGYFERCLSCNARGYVVKEVE